MTYNIKKLIPDPVGDNEEAIPGSRSRKDRWVREIGIHPERWITGTVIPAFMDAVRRNRLSAKLCVDGDRFFNKVLIDYEPLKPLTASTNYVGPPVILEFGATSTGDPFEQRHIVCYASGPKGREPLDYPDVETGILQAARTVREKATTIHVYCLRRRGRGKRLFRHWYDLVRLDETGFLDEALQDQELAMHVARHKAAFHSERDAENSVIDYRDAVRGGLVPVPEGQALDALREDYEAMKDANMLPELSDIFDDIMKRCGEIQTKVNKQATATIQSA